MIEKRLQFKSDAEKAGARKILAALKRSRMLRGTVDLKAAPMPRKRGTAAKVNPKKRKWKSATYTHARRTVRVGKRKYGPSLNRNPKRAGIFYKAYATREAAEKAAAKFYKRTDLHVFVEKFENKKQGQVWYQVRQTGWDSPSSANPMRREMPICARCERATSKPSRYWGSVYCPACMRENRKDEIADKADEQDDRDACDCDECVRRRQHRKPTR